MDELDVREFLPVVIASYPGLTAAAHHQAAAALTAVVLHAGYRDGRLICLAPDAGVYEMARPWIEGRKTLAAYLRLLEEGGFANASSIALFPPSRHVGKR